LLVNRYSEKLRLEPGREIAPGFLLWCVRIADRAGLSPYIQQGRRRPMPFMKGQSGNPAGRVPGSRNKATIRVQEALERKADEIVDTAVTLAIKGDIGALRMCMDRLLPPKKSEPAACELPRLEKAADAVVAMSAIASAVSDGDVTADEAGKLAKVVDIYVNALAAHNFEERLVRLEEADVPPRDDESAVGLVPSEAS
jgi:Family of unknown function (DUF5681)